MPKIRLLVPRDIEGESHAAGAEVDVDVETATELRAAGAASFIDDEKAAEKAAQEGNYSARMTRSDAGEAVVEDEPPKTRKK